MRCTRFILVVLLLPAATRAQGVLYFSQDALAQGLFELDPVSGAATNVGTSGVTGTTCGLCESDDPTLLYGSMPFGFMRVQANGSGSAPVGGATMEAMAFDPTTNTVYAALNGAFFTVDRMTGAQGPALAAPGADVEGLAWDNGFIFGIGGATLFRYTIATNNWTVVGAHGIAGWDNGGLAYDPIRDVLFTKTQGNLNLFSVNKMTAASTIIGSTGITAGGGLAFVLDGVTCSPTVPASPASGDIDLPVNVQTTTASTMFDLSFDFSTDVGVSFSPCTTAVGSAIANPAIGVPVGVSTYRWDSVADNVGLLAVAVGVILRVTANDALAPMPGTCTATFDVDNVLPSPTCTLTGPAAADHDIPLAFEALSSTAASVDVVFEFSLDGGATFSACTAAPGSALPSPAPGTATGAATFTWDSDADGVGLVALQPGVIVRATVSDPMFAVLTSTCATNPIDIDNTALCNGICGDCDLGGAGPTIIDALTGAQLSAGLFLPTPVQEGCCDVNSSLAIDILDALTMAQSSAGLVVTLICP